MGTLLRVQARGSNVATWETLVLVPLHCALLLYIGTEHIAGRMPCW